jgi:hypothetical protein
MSEELQNDVDLDIDINDDIDGGDENHDDNGSDLAPEENGDDDSTSEEAKAEAKQAAIQKTINTKHAQAKQAERERDEALARIAQFEDAQRKQMADQLSVIPEYPDKYDDNFEEKVRARDEALVRQANFSQSQQAYNQQQQQHQQAGRQKQALATQEMAASYNTRAVELDIPSNVLQAAGQAVAGMGVGELAVMHILGHQDGPLITKYLADNPMDAIELASMSEFAQGAYLEQVHAKALAKTPLKKKSKAPRPPSDISGSGVKAKDGNYPNSRGAKFT